MTVNELIILLQQFNGGEEICFDDGITQFAISTCQADRLESNCVILE